MPLDPQFEAFVLQAPLTEIPLEEFRQLMREAFASMPKAQVARVEDRVIAGPAGEMPVRIYSPENAKGAPLLIFIHGGGWTFGDLETHDHVCRSLVEAVGAVVAGFEYRLAPEHKYPAAADDSQAAVEWLLDNCEALGCDPRQVIISGDSAGGNLAALVSQRLRGREGTAIAFQILIYPATDFSRKRDSFRRHADAPTLTTADAAWAMGNYLRDEADAVDPQAAPHLCSDLSGLPSAFVLTAEIDPLCDDGEDYARRLLEAGVPVMARRYLGAPHGFLSASAELPAVREAFGDIARAVRWALD